MRIFLFSTFLVISILQKSGIYALEKYYEKDLPDLEQEQNRTGKLFKVIKVAPNPCSGRNGSSVSGICYPSATCTSRGGQALGMGTCGPYATCCQFNITTTESDVAVTVREKVATIQSNNDFTLNQFIFPKMDEYCQLKLDFHQFEFDSPNNEGDCVTDVLSFSGTVTVRTFNLCGNIRFTQPLYLTYGPNSNIELNFKSDNRNRFMVLVTQIRCDSRSLVDEHCLQQYNAGTGTVTSFGHPAFQINGQEYDICIGRNTVSGRRKALTWDMCAPPVPPVVSNFHLTNYFGATAGVFGGGFGELTCERTSFVKIAGRDMYCGAYFPQTAVTGEWPNILSVRIIKDDILRFPAPSYSTIIFQDSTQCTTAQTATIYITCAPFPGTVGFSPLLGTCKCKDPDTSLPVPTTPRTGFCLKYS